MTEKSTTEVATAAPTTPKKAVKTKKPYVKPTHPPASEMVLAAIKSLKERNGSSLQAIKKYIAANYKVDVDKQSTFIKKYLKSAVEQKAITQTKGKGASGSFKINVAKSESKKSSKPKVAKAITEKKSKAAGSPMKKVVKKTAAVAKKPAEKKAAETKKPATSKPAVSKPAAKKSVAKKTTKSPVAKPKAPKPKKTTAVKKPIPKKK